ncbi:F0F1 ATP synthase subunit B [Cryptosporangium arvum]|uniref:F0F1 ATP synthase subunit B n=1 Tax=Cryptosporangium arvum TaxID=80871 RepID=UPI0004B7F72B|nr:F0F1 ATP synthase subunit B [Cryptosporangium arvum]
MSATTEIVTTLLASEDGEVNPLLPHTSELIVGLVAFALLFWFLAKKVYPLFEKTYEERSEAIEGGIKRAEEAQAEAKAALEQYRAQLADARGEAGRIREEARAEGARIIDEMRAEAQEQAARIVERGEEQLAAERQRLVTEIRADIGRIAVDLAGRIVGESLADEARRTGTVERFLDDLDTTTGGRR